MTGVSGLQPTTLEGATHFLGIQLVDRRAVLMEIPPEAAPDGFSPTRSKET
jgi:hypothetical protein